MWHALTDGAPTTLERLGQATEVAVRRLHWAVVTEADDPTPAPEPIPIGKEAAEHKRRMAEADAREARLVDQLIARTRELAERAAMTQDGGQQ